MIKRIKLIFYITSAVVLGLLTIWQIYTVRGVLVAGGGKQLDAELNQVQTVVRMWEKRKPFNAESVDGATPSADRVTTTPTVVEEEEVASPSATDTPEN